MQLRVRMRSQMIVLPGRQLLSRLTLARCLALIQDIHLDWLINLENLYAIFNTL